MAEKQTKRTLTAKELENINKMPTARLLLKLAESGLAYDRLESMEREELVRAWISAVSEGRDIPTSAPTVSQTSSSAIVLDPVIAQKQLEFERLKFEQELQFRQTQFQQQQQLEVEKLKIENARLQQQQLLQQQQHQLQQQQQQQQQQLETEKQNAAMQLEAEKLK